MKKATKNLLATAVSITAGATAFMYSVERLYYHNDNSFSLQRAEQTAFAGVAGTMLALIIQAVS